MFILNTMACENSTSYKSMGSMLADKFKKFLGTGKVQKAATIEDVRRAMNRTIRKNEDAFWSYVKRKANRNVKAGIALSPVEEIAMDKNDKDDNPYIYPIESNPVNEASLFNRFYTTVVTQMERRESVALMLGDILERSKTWPYIHENFDIFEKYIRKRARNAENPDDILSMFVIKKYEFSDDNAPDTNEGFFVYHVSNATNGKVGKHFGTMKQLAGRYRTPYHKFNVVAFDCSGYDYTAVEQFVLAAMKAFGHHIIREQVDPRSVGLFVNILTSFFDSGSGGGYTTPGDPCILWFDKVIQGFTPTGDPKDVILLKDIYNDYLQYLLATKQNIIPFKGFVKSLETHQNVADKKLIGYKSTRLPAEDMKKKKTKKSCFTMYNEIFFPVR